ncbi:MAG: CPBP family intramembrane glutamic endopeptidase [Psychroserpens sp.]|uniref:CPBP family intramembrane glutamic endopeptidase n=1 Tax=Psychroserpens sp. TaxID=2020870 RepID=UPI0030013283
MKSKFIVSVLLIFTCYFIIDDMYFNDFRSFINQYINQKGISHIISYLVFGTPLIIGTLLIHRFKNFFGSLGLNSSISKGFLIPLLWTIPMLIGYASLFSFNSEVTLNQILFSGIAAAFFEEVYFRGFLFGQLYRYTKLGFIPSVIAGALLFAIIHLYQSQEFSELLGIFLVTFVGALLFAWLYIEWKNNIWIPIFLHFFMNIFWLFFSVGDNALGGVYANVIRTLTVVLVIVSTIIYKRRKGIPLEINKRTLWLKKSNNI